jgi:putative mRNA 3-end processing factor
MKSLFFLESYGFLPFRRKSKRGSKPHLTLRFNAGNITDIHIDSYRGYEQENYKYFNLITHAHSDHYGQNNMSNPFSLASIETADILSAISGKRFQGDIFSVGETFRLGDFKVKTYSTDHMFGSTAFLIKGECRILVTGDVKDYRKLPECDVLITEATYGNPDFIFEEEIDRLIECARNSTFGVYPVGKAQRTARILLENGFEVAGEERISELCRLFDIDVVEKGDVKLVSPRNLYSYKGNRYVLTAQKFYRFPRIVVSDHLDFNGILSMIEHCNPEHIIFYHGKPSENLIEQIDRDVSVLNELDVMSEFVG